MGCDGDGFGGQMGVWGGSDTLSDVPACLPAEKEFPLVDIHLERHRKEYAIVESEE